MNKDDLTLLMRLAFEEGELYYKRKSILIDTDVASNIAFSKNAGGQLQDKAKEGLNIESTVKGIMRVSLEYNKMGYSKEKVDELLKEPWNKCLEIINMIYK